MIKTMDKNQTKTQKVILNRNLRLYATTNHDDPFYGKGSIVVIPESLAAELLIAGSVTEAPKDAQEKFLALVHEAPTEPMQGTNVDIQTVVNSALARQKKELTAEFDEKLAEYAKKK